MGFPLHKPYCWWKNSQGQPPYIYTIYVITSSAACFLSPYSHRRAHFPATVPMRTAMLSGVTQTAPKQIYNTSFTPTSYDATHLYSYHCLEISFTWKIHLSRRQVPPESAAVAFWGNRSLGLEIADALVQVWRDEFRNTNTSRLRFFSQTVLKFSSKKTVLLGKETFPVKQDLD